MTHRRSVLRYASLILLPFIAVYLFHERLITNHDPGNFLAAIELGLDAMAERPHVPGYPFFILLWQGLTSLGLTAEQAILTSNALWCSIGLVAIYRLARKFTSEDSAFLAALFVACNPLVLFYASTGETYVYDLAFSSLTVLAVMSAKREHLKWVWLAVGIAGGFRLSSIVFIYPAMLALTIVKKERVRKIAMQHLFLIVGVLLWVVPFTLYHGGLHELRLIAQATTELRSTVLQSASGYAGAALWMVNLALPLLLLAPKRLRAWPTDKRWILLAWIVVPTLFFIFRFYAKGYIIITLPAIAILLAGVVDLLHDWQRRLGVLAMRLGGLLVFFAIPFIPPNIEIEASRDLGDRVETAALRSISWYAPSSEHLRVRENAMDEAKQLIETWSMSGDTVILNRSVGMWAHPRSLGYHVRDRHLVMMASGGFASDFYRLEKHNLLRLEEMIPQHGALFLCDQQMIGFMPAIENFELVERGTYLSLYRAPAHELNALIMSLETTPQN